jgi:hypothetical protein
MEAENLVFESRKRISKQAVRHCYFHYYALFYNSLASGLTAYALWNVRISDP